ncbi:MULTISPECIES: sugar phosphate isomerase/epimerase family protein [unclassified Pantoea]|uniref:sugar phosphate isomerase/epimerase family protein n=1 Tax=unclassified Pantoea TaxID=2630326 RepID=UPI001CD6A1F2|nr:MULTISPECIES: TIM barrel protein [unclassified Pantoea]MCA1176345.1 sugar phosphate isomerase/epimerase [Pantoea sp. alder69]MCA1249315.1 sugar phosphate isomerase/epimerase [Pantoea sp. alder70]MCA1264610.1 sugar phosphate isomerase/epimerase [Pantoea sp. alder81]
MATTLYPSAHLAELFFPITNDEEALLQVIRKIAQSGYYQGFETGIFHQSAIAGKIHDIAQQHALRVTQWLTFELLKDNLNLSSLDQSLREKSIRRACELVHLAAECGTTKLSLVSGSDPGDAHRADAMKGFSEAVVRIGEEMNQYDGMLLQIEPLDRYAHKCQLIGPTDETVAWMKRLRSDCPKLYLAWDSAHVALNQEDLVESLTLAAPLISQLHLANAILDPLATGFGDYHMKFGEPGFLTRDVAAQIIDTARHLPLPAEVGAISIAVEMRTTDQDDLWDNELQCRTFLQSAWQA